MMTNKHRNMFIVVRVSFADSQEQRLYYVSCAVSFFSSQFKHTAIPFSVI